jgi:hypothetical protein
MEIAVMASFSAKGDMDVNAGHLNLIRRSCVDL